MNAVLKEGYERLAKWRRVFLGQFLGRDYLYKQPFPRGREKALIDLFEKTLFLRVEVSAMINILLKSGLITEGEYEVQLLTEIQEMHKAMEKKFPGFQAEDDGMRVDPQAMYETTKLWGA